MKGFIYAKGTRHFDYKTAKFVEGPEYLFHSTDNLSGEHFKDYVLICPHEIIVEIPDGFDPRAQLVQNLETEKKRLKAEFGRRVAQIEREIQTYLAIENRAEATS
jgi:hypothetical protein